MSQSCWKCEMLTESTSPLIFGAWLSAEEKQNKERKEGHEGGKKAKWFKFTYVMYRSPRVGETSASKRL